MRAFNEGNVGTVRMLFSESALRNTWVLEVVIYVLCIAKDQMLPEDRR